MTFYGEEMPEVCRRSPITCSAKTVPSRQQRRDTLSCQAGNHLSPLFEADNFHPFAGYAHHEFLKCPHHPSPIYAKQFPTPNRRSSVQFRKLSFRHSTVGSDTSPRDNRLTLLGKPIQPGTKSKQTLRHRCITF